MKFRDKWRSRITINGKTVSLGVFENEIDAAKEYDWAAICHFKNFSNLNFGVANV